MNNISNKNKPLKIELLHLGGILTHTSKGSTHKPLIRRRLNMVSKQSLSEKSRYNNNSLSHNIYIERSILPTFWHNPLAFIKVFRVLGYILASIFTMVYIYYLLHLVCLVDDACFALNYGVING